MGGINEIQSNYLEMLRVDGKEGLANNADTTSTLKKVLAQMGVLLKEENFKYIQTVGIVAFSIGTAKHYFNFTILFKSNCCPTTINTNAPVFYDKAKHRSPYKTIAEKCYRKKIS